MRFFNFLITSLLAGVVAVQPLARAQDDPFEDLVPGEGAAAGSSTVATLVSEVKAIAPGEPFAVALKLVHPAGWHSYYLNSGGLEQSPSLTWTLPDGFAAGEILWPVPDVTDGFFGKSFTYSGSPVFLVEITPPATLEGGSTVTLQASAKWQICKDVCKDEPGDGPARFEIVLPVAASSEPDPAQAALFAAARAAVPQPAKSWTVSAESAGPDVRVRIRGAAADLSQAAPTFIPDYPFIAVSLDGEGLARDGDDWLLTLKRITTDPVLDKPVPQGKAIAGILVGKSPLDGEATAVKIGPTAIGKARAKSLSLAAFLPVLGGMLLGGLILNLMPCVFPVLGLKIMGFVQQSGQDKRKIVMHGLIFTAGVLISFWIVSGILFVLRENSTAEIGWGYQLQNKWFVYGLVMLFWVFGLSMFGLFEIGASATAVGGNLQMKEGLAGSFFSGVLATIVATPCSAPILGPAIGAAITLPTTQFFTAFTAMALGLSLPYLLLSLFPKMVGILPRPGAWMESFKQAMAFLLIGAAAYFFWVYMDHVETDVLFLVLVGMVLVAVAAWIYGRWATPFRKRGTRIAGRVLAVAFAAPGFYFAAGPHKGLAWESWSQGKVDHHLGNDTPVYVDFTAKWCATCQLNKRVAYTDEVVALFKERGIVALRADKTRSDPEIDAKVAEFGRAAIPVNVLYVPGKDPIVTPEFLTPGYLVDLITREIPKPEK